MNKPDSLYTLPIVSDEFSDSDKKKWRVLYYTDRPTHKQKKHPIMDNFEILKEKNEELEKRIEVLEKQVERLSLRQGTGFF